MTDLTAEIPPELFARLAHPTVRLSGLIDEAAAASFLSQVLPALDIPGSIVVELFSSGGDAEVGRRLAQEVRLLRQAHGRDMWFLGKTLVASAAVTVMAAFARDRRWLTRDTTLLIHGRRMMRNVHLEGPLGSCRRVLEEIIADIDNGLRVEDERSRNDTTHSEPACRVDKKCHFALIFAGKSGFNEVARCGPTAEAPPMADGESTRQVCRRMRSITPTATP